MVKNLIIAIDQGNTKTDVLVLLPNGKILAREREEYKAINTILDFEQRRWCYLIKLVDKALAALCVSKNDIDYLLAAMCGADRDEDVVALQLLMATHLQIPLHKVKVVNDSIAAMRSGMPYVFDYQNYAVIYSGTMFNCTMVNSKKKMFSYNRLVNACDSGSYALGQSAWRAVVDSFNGFQKATIMDSLFLEYYNCQSIIELISKVTYNDISFDPYVFSSILLEAVQKKDAIAIEIMNGFVRRWVSYVVEGLPKIDILQHEKINVILAGGIFKKCSNLWVHAIENELYHHRRNIRCILAKVEPVVGAALLLLENYNKRIMNEEIICNLEQSFLYTTLQITSEK